MDVFGIRALTSISQQGGPVFRAARTQGGLSMMSWQGRQGDTLQRFDLSLKWQGRFGLPVYRNLEPKEATSSF